MNNNNVQNWFEEIEEGNKQFANELFDLYYKFLFRVVGVFIGGSVAMIPVAIFHIMDTASGAIVSIVGLVVCLTLGPILATKVGLWWVHRKES